MSTVAVPASGTSTAQSLQVTLQVPVAAQLQGVLELSNDAPHVTEPELPEPLPLAPEVVAPEPEPVVPDPVPVVAVVPDPEQAAREIARNIPVKIVRVMVVLPPR
jgi:hypothetical protein